MSNIREISTFISDGDWIESQDQSDYGIRLIQTGNIGNGEYLDKPDKAKYISEETYNKLHCTDVYPGDILISRLPDPIGRSCMVPQDIGRAITAVDCTILRVNRSNYNPHFFVHYTQTDLYRSKLSYFLTGTTRKRISRKNLEKIVVPHYSREHQDTIVKRLDKITHLISMRTRQLDKLDELVKSRFIEMFGNPNEIDNFANAQIKDIALVKVGIVIKPTRFYSNDKKGKCAFRSLNIVPFGVNPNSEWVYFTNDAMAENKRTIVHEGDVLVVRSGNPGTCCVVPKEYDGCNVIDLIIAHPDKNRILPEYLCAFTNMPHGMNQINNQKHGVAQRHFNVSMYERMKIYIPSLSQQHQFVDFMIQVDKSKYQEVSVTGWQGILICCNI